MDERSRHAYRELSPGDQPVAQHAASPAPWPQAHTGIPGGPITGHAPHADGPQLHTAGQFEYAASGFVLPGAAGGQQPLSAQAGTIGAEPTEGQWGQPGYLPMLAGSGAAPGHPAQLHQMQATMPQAWAFPTPHGMQLVQPGGRAMVQSPVQLPGPAPMPLALVHGGVGQAVRTRRRVRWETIVPIAALACFLGAVGVFVANFDRMTGQEGGPSTITEAAQDKAGETKQGLDGIEPPKPGDEAAAAEGASASQVARATVDALALMAQGRFDEASELLHPLLDGASPDPDVVALHDRVDAASARNTALLTRLSRQRAARQWSGSLVTIDQLAALRPLSPQLVRQRTQARTMVRTARTVAEVRVLMAQGRTSAAAAMLDAALKGSRSPQLETLREQLAAQRARPSTIATTTTTTAAAGTSTNRAPAPAPSSRPGTTGAAQPPANVTPGDMPPRPDAPNPIAAGGGVTGQPSATAGDHAGMEGM